MSMASGECADSLAPALPGREDAIHFAMARAGIAAARGLSAPADVHTLEPMDEPFFGRWCATDPALGTPSSHASQACVCSSGNRRK